MTQKLANITPVSENKRTETKRGYFAHSPTVRKYHSPNWNLDLSPKPFLFALFSIYMAGSKSESMYSLANR